MKAIIPKDPLLAAGKFVTIATQALMAIVMLGLAAAIPGTLLSSSHVEKNLPEAMSDKLPQALFAIEASLVIGLIVAAATFYFANQLGRIIDTVGKGEPFVAINAQRLSRMGWVSLAIQFVGIPITILVSYLSTLFPDVDISVEGGLSLSGFVLAITLFILARVFRKGTQMREELEGTV